MCKELSLAETATLLNSATNIVLVSHISPDGDTLGSALALAEGLKSLGKQVIVTVDDLIGSTYSFLPGIADIVTPVEGQVLAADLLVAIDSSSIDRLGVLSQLVQAPILNIDHHISNTKFADFLYLDATASATGEIIYSLLRQLQVDISLGMATNLYVAIVTDCGYFKYSNTTPKCMMTAAELVELGVKPNEVSDNLEMKSRDNLLLLRQILNTLAFAAEGKIASIEISLANYNKDIDTDAFIQYPRYIEGVEVAFMFKAVEQNVTRVSMRSRTIDVSSIALSFGGGGHKRAAGCTFHGDLTEAKTALIAAVQKEMDK